LQGLFTNDLGYLDWRLGVEFVEEKFFKKVARKTTLVPK